MSGRLAPDLIGNCGKRNIGVIGSRIEDTNEQSLELEGAMKKGNTIGHEARNSNEGCCRNVRLLAVNWKVGTALLTLFFLSAMIACSSGGSSSSASTPPPPPPTLQSISIGPSNTSIIAGRTQQFSATASYSDGSTKDVTSSAAWSSSNQAVATVSNGGLANTLTEGTATITATLQSIAGNTSLTATPLTVQVSVSASDSAGRPLFYQWLSTDGSIQDANAPTTTWTLPDGPGLHFAYVLVSNGFGGYTERRIAVNTDTIGTPLLVPSPQSVPIPPAPSSTQPANIFRGFLTGGKVNEISFPSVGVIPGIPVDLPANNGVPGLYAENTTTQIYSGPVSANVKGEFVFPNVDFTGGQLDVFDCLGTSLCGQWFGSPPYGGISAYGYSFSPYQYQQPYVPDIAGELLLADGSPCGTVTEFFGIPSTGAAASLIDSNSGLVLYGPVQTNEWGDYDLPAQPFVSEAPTSVSLQCENNPPVIIPVTNVNQTGTTDMGVTTLSSVSAPIVTSMSATLNGTQLGQFLPPVSGAPSDVVPLGDAFLSEKGVDSRIGACQYYKAVGAVQSCDSAGNFSGAITFEDWKSQVQIDQYANPNPTNALSSPVYTATYINKVDLNLVRNHHSVSNGIPSDPSILGQQPYTYVGTYVCNHSGPSVLDPAQSEIDSVIQNTTSGNNLVACVAMDYSTFPTVGDSYYGPFIRFLIFGPNGQLLPSVNLDGRREKFVPGTCVVCHGGDHYAGKYPEDGSGSPDVGGHFLPYDTGNFEFSSQSGMTEADQGQAIFNWNENIINIGGATAQTSQLIHGWYTQANGYGPPLNKNYVSPNWPQDSAHVTVYQNVYARSCRTCHIALPGIYNFESGGFFGANVVDPANCGGGIDRNRMYKMPNSLVTFNRFWGSQGSTTEPDQVALLEQLQGSGCTPTMPYPSARQHSGSKFSFLSPNSVQQLISLVETNDALRQVPGGKRPLKKQAKSEALHSALPTGGSR